MKGGNSVVSAAPRDSQVVAGAITFPVGTPLSDQDDYSLFDINKANNDVALDDALDRRLNFAAWLQPTGLVLENSDQLTIALAAWDDDGDLAWAVPLGQPESTS